MVGYKKAFTLLELIITVIIMGIGFAAVAGIFLAGTIFLRQAKNKSQAMSVASTQMESMLAYSYSSLRTGGPATPGYSGNEGNFRWEITVTDRGLRAPSGGGGHTCNPNASNPGFDCIPYKEIVVTAAYPEETIKVQKPEWKRVSLTNMIPYPQVHIEQETAKNTGEEARRRWRNINSLTLDFHYPVDKDLHVIYTLALDVCDPNNNIDPVDLLETRCTLDGRRKPITTRTPILTQPLITNSIQIHNVGKRPAGNQHNLRIQWRNRENHGRVELKKGQVIIIAYEK